MSYLRRFPPPWKIEENTESFVVVDGRGQQLAFLYYEGHSGRCPPSGSTDEAWRIARAITRIPGLMQRD